ncbi:MAG: hypothetical protein V3S33_03500 [Gammaproteobacteria bacterium]
MLKNPSQVATVLCTSRPVKGLHRRSPDMEINDMAILPIVARRRKHLINLEPGRTVSGDRGQEQKRHGAKRRTAPSSLKHARQVDFDRRASLCSKPTKPT